MFVSKTKFFEDGQQLRGTRVRPGQTGLQQVRCEQGGVAHKATFERGGAGKS